MHANCRVANFGKTFLFLFSKVRLGDSIEKTFRKYTKIVHILCIFETIKTFQKYKIHYVFVNLC